MADNNNTAAQQPEQAVREQGRPVDADTVADAMQDWEIDHSTGKRKAHPGQGDHFVGNAAETLQAPITNEPADQTRSHGNRPKEPMRQR